jgi:serine/threonine protein kinase
MHARSVVRGLVHDPGIIIKGEGVNGLYSGPMYRLGDLLGSGQFGMVYKGVMDCGSGEMDVAVKTLKEGSGGMDRVKFLQEAAIMGQFKHHNVVTTYGVVTQGEPVSQIRLVLLVTLHDFVGYVSPGVASQG